MAESRQPLLRDSLTLPEKVMLAGLTRHVGFSVFTKLIDALIVRSTESMVKLDPESDNYERILAVRQQKSRNTQENARDLRESVLYHIESAGGVAQQDLDNQLQIQGE